MGSVLIYLYIAYVKHLLPLIILFLLLQSCSKDCGCSFAYSMEIGQQLNMATGFTVNTSSQAPNDEPDEIRYKAKLSNECATYLGKTIKVDTQGFKNGKKIGAETSTDLLMTEGMITFINSGEVGVKVGYSTLTRKGCN